MSNKCAWEVFGTSCSGNLKNRSIFKKQININMCDWHYNNHLITMSIANLDKETDIEVVIRMPPEDQLKKLEVLCADNNKILKNVLEETANNE